MTVQTSGYTLGSNQPLHHARILWEAMGGTFPTDTTGTNPDYALNDYTNQRWTFDASVSAQTWTLTTAADEDVDTIIIAAHTLGSIGATISALTSTVTSSGTPMVERVAPFAVQDNGAIALMFNNAGSPYTVRRIRILIASGPTTPGQIGIIRAGVAMQMPRPLGYGAEPIGLRPVTEIRHMDSETGQWLGRTVQRRRREANIGWSHLDAAWYRSTFAPFAETLPQKPFGLIQNAVSMPESVAWCWTNDDPAPSYSEGKRINFGMSLTGFDG